MSEPLRNWNKFCIHYFSCVTVTNCPTKAIEGWKGLFWFGVLDGKGTVAGT